MPRRYYPTEKNFKLHKPSVTMELEAYGDLYYSKLMASPTVANSVLKLRRLRYSIDELGFRETTPLGQARIIVLGDSFTYGVDTSQDKTWVELLEQAIKEPVYNFGVSGTSPKQELMLLEYMLTAKSQQLRIRHLLWMIYEGNDLEDSYETLRQAQAGMDLMKRDFTNMFKGTLVNTLASIPATIKNQSVINRLMDGHLVFVLPFRTTGNGDPYIVDGMRLAYPFYYSKQYGYRLFVPQEIERACKSESYVLSHPNRGLLDRTFEDMVSLTQKYGFKVTVLIAPSASRLYAKYFENFPTISEDPYFINFVEKLSRMKGFDVINLYQKMQPYAKESLLYWRDGSHWNERGHEVVAEIIAKHFVNLQPGLTDQSDGRNPH
jgi:lysophospholipase L1-like esterase